MMSLAGVVPAVAAPRLVFTNSTPNRFVTGWIPYWQVASGTATLTGTTSSPLVSELSLMWFDQDLRLMASADSLNTVVAAARAQGIPVLPTIFGTRTDVFSPAKVAAHTTAITDLVVAKGYDGIDIDYEFVWSVPRTSWSTLQPQWVTFVQLLATKLHAKGKLLSVTVPPVWNSGSSGYTVYAQPSIASAVDRLRLMVYDWSISDPGNIAPNHWVNSVISYSTDTAKVHPKKLQLGVPAYGRHWWTKKVSTEVCPDGALKDVDSIRMSEVAGLLAGKAVTSTRVNGEMRHTWDEQVTGPSKLPPIYTPVTGGLFGLVEAARRAGLVPAVRLGVPRTVTCTVQHVVYVPDAVTIATNARSALNRGWSGIAMWTFGYESPDLWSRLNDDLTIPLQRATGAPRVVNDATSYAAGVLRVRGVAYRPQWDLPVPVRIQLKQGTTVVRTITVLANRSRTLAAALQGIGPFHGYDQGFNGLPAGAYTVCTTMLRWGGGTVVADCDAATVPAS